MPILTMPDLIGSIGRSLDYLFLLLDLTVEISSSDYPILIAIRIFKKSFRNPVAAVIISH